MATRTELVESARKLVGVRFRWNGRAMNGVDCWGVFVLAGSNVGLSVHDAPYGRFPQDDFIIDELNVAATKKPIHQMQPGDVLVLGVAQASIHTALVTDLGGRFGMIHASIVLRKVVEHGIDEVWRKRIAACYQLNGVE